jgi:hypothetical protein
VQARFRFARKSTGKYHDGSECARFTIDRRIGPFVVRPDLAAVNPTNRPKIIPNGVSIAGAIALRARAHSPLKRTLMSP